MYLLRKVISRHRYTSTVAALLLLIILGFAGVTLYLWRAAENARQGTQVIAQQWQAEADRTHKIARLLAFRSFLRAWEQDRNEEATGVLSYLSKGSKEQKAAKFLLNPNSLAEKEPGFRRSFSDKDRWFVDFIVGETHRKNAASKEALAAYQRGYEAVQKLSQVDQRLIDRPLASLLLARLRELDSTDEPEQSDAIQ